MKAGHLEHARASLEAAAVDTIEFSDFGPNPDADMLEAGRRHAAGKRIDSLIGLGGGSSLDCAKGINFLLTQGGAIHDFQGYGKAMKPMLPMIGVPTTAGCAEFAYVPTQSAHVVQKLIDAGAIPMGKTNLDQFATGLVGVRYAEACRARSPWIIRGSVSGPAGGRHSF